VRNFLDIVVRLDSRESSSKEIRAEVLCKVARNKLEWASGDDSKFSACAECWEMVLLHLSLIDWSFAKMSFKLYSEGFRFIFHNPKMFFIENLTPAG
jgi:hypothetical protein